MIFTKSKYFVLLTAFLVAGTAEVCAMDEPEKTPLTQRPVKQVSIDSEESSLTSLVQKTDSTFKGDEDSSDSDSEFIRESVAKGNAVVKEVLQANKDHPRFLEMFGALMDLDNRQGESNDILSTSFLSAGTAEVVAMDDDKESQNLLVQQTPVQQADSLKSEEESVSSDEEGFAEAIQGVFSDLAAEIREERLKNSSPTFIPSNSRSYYSQSRAIELAAADPDYFQKSHQVVAESTQQSSVQQTDSLDSEEDSESRDNDERFLGVVHKAFCTLSDERKKIIAEEQLQRSNMTPSAEEKRSDAL